METYQTEKHNVKKPDLKSARTEYPEARKGALCPFAPLFYTNVCPQKHYGDPIK
jgi:hypothetical protein